MHRGPVLHDSTRGGPGNRGAGGGDAARGNAGHTPVMLEEALSLMGLRPGGLWVDATLGGGGHAEEILKRTSPEGVLIGVDADGEAVARCVQRLKNFGARFRPFKANYAELPSILNGAGLGRADGVLADLGTSSFQLDDAVRGFSFAKPGPVDMRMDARGGRTAMELIERMEERELAGVIARYGEERSAGRVAGAIKRALAEGVIKDTVSLAGVVSAAAWKRGGIHPATRTFQALRMAVNGEIESLESFMKALPEVLAPGGRAVIVSFHSLEDRMVKSYMREMATGCRCPSDLPVCACGRTAMGRLLTSGALTASEAEIGRNPRARSARLRAVEMNRGGVR